MNDTYDITIMITSVETDSIEKLKKEVWRMRSMLELMAVISDIGAIRSFCSVRSGVEKVSE